MIRSIQVNRFKSLRHTPEIRLGRVNLLTGANGRGKSSLCQVLLLLSQTWKSDLMNNLLPNGMWKSLGTYDDIVYTYDDDKSIEFNFVTDAAAENRFHLVYRKSKERPTLGTVDEVKVDGRPISDSSASTLNFMVSENFDLTDSADGDVRLTKLSDYPSLMALQRMYYIAAERKAASFREAIDDSMRDDFLSPYGTNVLNLLWRHRDEGILHEVERMLQQVMDGGMISIRSLGNELELTLNSVANSILYQPVNVGFGFSYLLSLITAVVLAPNNSFLIVENPEAHLHPAAQARMMNLLIDCAYERGIQLFVETHSDHILNSALRAVKEPGRSLTSDDFEVVFFTNTTNQEGHAESKVMNLEVNRMGHILNPPTQFFEQYALDLRALYAPPHRNHE